MKKSKLCFSILLAAILFGAAASAQDWVAKMQNPNVNFFEVQKAFNKVYAEKEKEMLRERISNAGRELQVENYENEIPGYAQYKRWEWFMTPRVSKTGERFDPSMVWREMEKYNSSNRSITSGAGNWTFIGPTTTASLSGAGRLNFVRIHPTNANTLFVGSPSGGLWKSTNGGTSWTSNTDLIAQVIGCTDLAIDPVNPNIMYLATGDGDASDNYSVGILKTTDGGNTWNTTGLSFSVGNTRTMSKILIDPNNTSTLIAATSGGIFRSADAGVTFTMVQGGSFKDMEFMPGDPNTVYACGTEFFVSSDNGVTWVRTTAGLPTAANVSRMAIAVTPGNVYNVYMIIGLPAPNYGTLGFFRSTNQGASFAQFSTPSLGNQQWYDLCIAVNPSNALEVMVGGQTQFQKSTNQGSTWTNIGGGMHVDHHDVIYTSSTTLYVANDGGIFRSTNNGSSWTNLNNNLAISQMYGFGQSTSNANLLLTGWQDNGTNRYNGAWSASMGGDGMLAFIGRTNDQNMWGSQYNGSLNRSTNGGGSWSGANSGITEAGAWVTPWREDPVTANTLWAGFINMWKSTNGGQSWTSPGTITGNTATIVAIAISPANNQVIWASTGNALYKSINGGATWSAVTSVPLGYISYIACSNADANKAWVTYSGFNAANKVYQTNNQGTTWTDVSSLSMPNIPVNCIAYMNGSNDGLYIGTDAGVFYKDATMNVWQPFGNGLPNVVVSQIEIYYAGNKIRTSTYGRGMWESDYYVPGGNYSPSAYFTASQTIACPGAAVQFTDYSGGFPTSWSWSFPGGSPAASTAQNPLVYYNTPGTYPVTLIAINAAGTDTTTFNSFINISASTINAPSASGVDFCAPGVVNLSATPAAPGVVRWWDAPGGGNLLATGTTYSPTLTTTTSVYVDEDFPSGSVNDGVGELDNTIGAGMFFIANDIRGLYFDVTEPVILDSVQVYSNSAAYRIIEVIDASGNSFVDTNVFIPASPSNLTTVRLNFPLYPGTGYFIKCRGLVDLYRNSTGAGFPYTPYISTTSITITGTNAGSGGYYYFFYNWAYHTFVCNTARTAVVATDTCAVISVNEIFGGGNELSIYPNPSTAEITMSFAKAAHYNVQLHNTLGEVLQQTQTNSATLTLNISRYTKGIYFITVTDEQRNKVMRKVVKL